MTKEDYRSFFASCKYFIKINYFLKENKIQQPSFSCFMKGNDWSMSLENLEKLYKDVTDACTKIA